MGKRNAYALAAQQRKAGPHSHARRPDVFDHINAYMEAHLQELIDRKRNYGVGDRVLCVSDSPYCGCEGLVVKRDENVDGEPVWTVDFEGAGMNCHLSNELERVY